MPTQLQVSVPPSKVSAWSMVAVVTTVTLIVFVPLFVWRAQQARSEIAPLQKQVTSLTEQAGDKNRELVALTEEHRKSQELAAEHERSLAQRKQKLDELDARLEAKSKELALVQQDIKKVTVEKVAIDERLQDAEDTLNAIAKVLGQHDATDVLLTVRQVLDARKSTQRELAAYVAVAREAGANDASALRTTIVSLKSDLKTCAARDAWRPAQQPVPSYSFPIQCSPQTTAATTVPLGEVVEPITTYMIVQ